METGGSKKKKQVVTPAAVKATPKAGAATAAVQKKPTAGGKKAAAKGTKTKEPEPAREFSQASLMNQLRLGGVHTFRPGTMTKKEFSRGLSDLYLEPLPEFCRHLAALVDDREPKSGKGVRVKTKDLDFIWARPRIKRLVGLTDVEEGTTAGRRRNKAQ
jgi:hypothetical protein